MPTMVPAVAPPPAGDPMQPPPAMPQPYAPPYPPPAGAAPPAPGYGSMEPTQYGANFNTNYGPSAPAPPAQPSAPVIFAPYPDMPPPNYSEAVGAGASLKDDDDNDHIRADAYKPLYPTYTWNFEKS